MCVGRDNVFHQEAKSRVRLAEQGHRSLAMKSPTVFFFGGFEFVANCWWRQQREIVAFSLTAGLCLLQPHLQEARPSDGDVNETSC